MFGKRKTFMHGLVEQPGERVSVRDEDVVLTKSFILQVAPNVVGQQPDHLFADRAIGPCPCGDEIKKDPRRLIPHDLHSPSRIICLIKARRAGGPLCVCKFERNAKFTDLAPFHFGEKVTFAGYGEGELIWHREGRLNLYQCAAGGQIPHHAVKRGGAFLHYNLRAQKGSLS